MFNRRMIVGTVVLSGLFSVSGGGGAFASAESSPVVTAVSSEGGGELTNRCGDGMIEVSSRRDGSEAIVNISGVTPEKARGGHSMVVKMPSDFKMREKVSMKGTVPLSKDDSTVIGELIAVPDESSNGAVKLVFNDYLNTTNCVPFNIDFVGDVIENAGVEGKAVKSRSSVFVGVFASVALIGTLGVITLLVLRRNARKASVKRQLERRAKNNAQVDSK